jgi:hypothetical protein
MGCTLHSTAGHLATIGHVGEFITGVATTGLAVVAALTVLGARKGFRQQQEGFLTQRAESSGRWLLDLHARFTTEPSFQSIRRQLYNREESELVKALVHKHAWDKREAGPLSREEQKLVVELDDYLDFFALLLHLVEEGHLDVDDAYNLFSWYALDALEVDEVKTVITENFQNSVVKLCAKFNEIHAQRQASTRLTSEPQSPVGNVS